MFSSNDHLKNIDNLTLITTYNNIYKFNSNHHLKKITKNNIYKFIYNDHLE
jgi:hypothetical protein